ncbi:hypothetical protein Pelo_11076 [Pelomyxa schiedti]|nr:hypothetical protein Pelo_11076 [Pelomyxa schiedti]
MQSATTLDDEYYTPQPQLYSRGEEAQVPATTTTGPLAIDDCYSCYDYYDAPSSSPITITTTSSSPPGSRLQQQPQRPEAPPSSKTETTTTTTTTTTVSWSREGESAEGGEVNVNYGCCGDDKEKADGGSSPLCAVNSFTTTNNTTNTTNTTTTNNNNNNNNNVHHNYYNIYIQASSSSTSQPPSPGEKEASAIGKVVSGHVDVDIPPPDMPPPTTPPVNVDKRIEANTNSEPVLTPEDHKRFSIGEELISSERQFIALMEDGTRALLQYLLTPEASKDSDFADKKLMLRDLEKLIEIHKEFLNVLGPHRNIGERILQQLASWKSLYSVYVTRKMVQQMELNLEEMLSNTSSEPEDNFLQEPFNQIYKIISLFKRIADATPASHMDHTNTTDVITQFQEIGDYVVAYRILGKIKNYKGPTIASPTSVQSLVRHGPAIVDSSNRYLWLFTGTLVLTKFVKTNTKQPYKYKQAVELFRCAVDLLSTPKGNAFRITSPACRGTIEVSSNRDDWVLDIKRLVAASLADQLNEAGKSASANKSVVQRQREAFLKNEVKRKEVMTKISLGETEYLVTLHDLQEALQSVNEKLLLSDDVNRKQAKPFHVLYNDIADMIKFHEGLHTLLTRRVAEWDTRSTVSDIFTDQLPALRKKYVSYTKKHSEKLKTAEDFIRGHPDLFNKISGESPEVLRQLLSAPLFRISQYCALCQELLECTNCGHFDHDRTSQLVRKMEELSSTVSTAYAAATTAKTSPSHRS